VQWADHEEGRRGGWQWDISFPSGRPDWTYKERIGAQYLTAGSPW
jgi:hypothetical protein